MVLEALQVRQTKFRAPVTFIDKAVKGFCSWQMMTFSPEDIGF